MPELIKTNLGGSFWHRNGFSLLKNFTNNSLLFEDVFFLVKVYIIHESSQVICYIRHN